jgi:hypothetical protein
LLLDPHPIEKSVNAAAAAPSITRVETHFIDILLMRGEPHAI